MLIDKVKDTIQKHRLIERKEHIVIGLSGGPDSVCLFHILCQLRRKLEFSLYAVHVNHGFRPGAAEEDAVYVEELCRRYDIPWHSVTIDVPAMAEALGLTSEEAGRKARYDAFYEMAAKLPQKRRIAVAHNLNDQAETVLLRILRGTGTDGLSGMEYERNGRGDIPIIRPLLDVKREEIEAYCRQEGLEPRMDSTNLLPLYTRNKVRLSLLPQLKEYNPNIIDAFRRLSQIASEDRSYFNGEVEGILKKHLRQRSREGERCGYEISLGILKALHPALLKRLLLKVWGMLGVTKDITALHLDRAVALIQGGKSVVQMDFPGGNTMVLRYGVVEFCRSGFYFPPERQQKKDLQKKLITKIVENAEIQGINNTVQQAFDYLAIRETGCEPLLRYRKAGDWIRPKGMKGRKKLQDFFTDAKVRREERDQIPLVCLGSEVIWIIGYRISENYRVNEKTENILLLEYCDKL